MCIRRRAAREIGQPPLVIRGDLQRAGKHIVVGIEENELGSGEFAYLPQQAVGEREGALVREETTRRRLSS